MKVFIIGIMLIFYSNWLYDTAFHKGFLAGVYSATPHPDEKDFTYGG